MLTVYGLRSCDTCREALKYLEEHGVPHAFHDVRADGLDIETLERWADHVGWETLLNRRSLTWRKLPEVDRRDINKAKALSAMIDYPTLVKRPIFETADSVAVGLSGDRLADYVAGLP